MFEMSEKKIEEREIFPPLRPAQRRGGVPLFFFLRFCRCRAEKEIAGHSFFLHRIGLRADRGEFLLPFFFLSSHRQSQYAPMGRSFFFFFLFPSGRSIWPRRERCTRSSLRGSFFLSFPHHREGEEIRTRPSPFLPPFFLLSLSSSARIRHFPPSSSFSLLPHLLVHHFHARQTSPLFSPPPPYSRQWIHKVRPPPPPLLYRQRIGMDHPSLPLPTSSNKK